MTSLNFNLKINYFINSMTLLKFPTFKLSDWYSLLDVFIHTIKWL